MITATTIISPRGHSPRRVSEYSNETTPPPKEQHYFPFKLYNMLQHAAGSEHGSAVSWVNEGRAFAIHDRDEFLELVVPLFFNQTKFRSFTRQLNLWGFKRLGNIWRHEHFISGRPDRLLFIKRVEVKGAAKTNSHQAKAVNRRHSYGTDEASCARPLLASAALSTASTRGSFFAALANIPLSSILDEAERVHAQPPSPNQTTRALIPNGAFQRQTVLQPPFVACPQRVVTSRVSFSEDSQCEPPSRDALGRDDISHAQQPPANEQDILFVLSGLFNSTSQEDSSRNDDLSSILSLDEASEDFMNPISF